MRVWFRGAMASMCVGAVLLQFAAAEPATAAPRPTLTVRVLMLKPTAGTAPWTAADLTAATRSAAGFWTAATGGALRFRVVPALTRTANGLGHCDFGADQRLARSLFGIARPAPSTIYVVGNPLSNCKRLLGAGDYKGAWLTVQRADPGIVAHELGHNLGLRHAGAASCPLPDKQYGLSIPDSSCTVSEYGDSDDIMGNNFDVQLLDVGLSSISLSLLRISQPTTVASAMQSTLEPVDTTRTSLAVPTKFGRAFIEYGIGHKGTLFGSSNSRTVQIRIQRTSTSGKPIQSVQLWMHRDPQSFGDADGPYLYPGDDALIPGSNLRLRIGAMDATGADIALVDKNAQTTSMPAAPTSVVSGGGQLRYAAVLSPDHSGFVYFIKTLSGPRIVGSARGAALMWQLPSSVNPNGILGVAAISRAGVLSAVTWESPIANG